MLYGFDMGGTKIEMAVFDSQLKQLWQKRVATPKNDYQALLHTFKQLTDEADQRFSCKGKIGIGIPGLIDHQQGTIFTTNVPAAKYQPLCDDLQQLLQRPIKIDNDANCFALSEAWHEDYRAYESVLGIILGTGVGGGLVIEGRLFSGKNSAAGEIGHLGLPASALALLEGEIPLLPCGCGKKGCIENYLSGRGFEWLYHHFYQQSLSAPDIVERYYNNDTHAIEHVERYLSLLAHCLGDILTLFDPHLVVLGGGLSQFDILYSELPKRLPQHLFSVARVPPIKPAYYGDAGGVRGAAFLNLPAVR